MPSPFPGMDPYLEHPDHFPGLHDWLIIYLADTLQPQLPETYFVKPGQRIWVEYGPITTPVIVDLPDLPDDEHREPFLEIYAGRGQDKRLVTAIEVLSPSGRN